MTESTRKCQKTKKNGTEISILGAFVALSELFFTILSCELSFALYRIPSRPVSVFLNRVSICPIPPKTCLNTKLVRTFTNDKTLIIFNSELSKIATVFQCKNWKKSEASARGAWEFTDDVIATLDNLYHSQLRRHFQIPRTSQKLSDDTANNLNQDSQKTYSFKWVFLQFLLLIFTHADRHVHMFPRGVNFS